MRGKRAVCIYCAYIMWYFNKKKKRKRKINPLKLNLFTVANAICLQEIYRLGQFMKRVNLYINNSNV